MSWGWREVLQPDSLAEMRVAEMKDYPIKLEEIAPWIASKEALWKGVGVSFVGLQQRTEFAPAGFADFDCVQTIGRVSFWVTGQFDFEVLRISDGQFAFFRHEHVQALYAPSLDAAFTEFLNAMSNPTSSSGASDQHSLGG